MHAEADCRSVKEALNPFLEAVILAMTNPSFGMQDIGRVDLEAPMGRPGQEAGGAYSELERGLMRLEALSGLLPSCAANYPHIYQCDPNLYASSYGFSVLLELRFNCPAQTGQLPCLN